MGKQNKEDSKPKKETFSKSDKKVTNKPIEKGIGGRTKPPTGN